MKIFNLYQRNWTGREHQPKVPVVAASSVPASASPRDELSQEDGFSQPCSDVVYSKCS